MELRRWVLLFLVFLFWWFADSAVARNDTAAYRTNRTGIGIGASTYARNASTGSSLPSCRSGLPSVGSTSSSRDHSKDRTISSYGSAYAKKDKLDDKHSSFKYSCTKDREDKGRSSSVKSPSMEDTGKKSPVSGRSSLLERYPFTSGKTGERPSSVLERYSRASSREKSREPDSTTRYATSTYPGSSLARSYCVVDPRADKKDRNEHSSPVSYRNLRSNSGRISTSSREPSPEFANSIGKTNSYRIYSRAPPYSRTGTPSSASESSSAPISSRYGSTSSSRFSLSSRSSSDRVPTALSYSGSDRFRASSGKPLSASFKDDDASPKISGCYKAEKESCQETTSRGQTSKTEEDSDRDCEGRSQESELVTVTMTSRGTSPTPPASSTYVRNRRADSAVVVQKEVTKSRRKVDTKLQEVQCDRPDETSSRYSRFGGGSGGASAGRVTGAPWSSYLDKLSNSTVSPGSGSSLYSSRGFNSATGVASNCSRIGSYVFSRPSESSTSSASACAGSASSSSSSRNDPGPKVSPASSQEVHGCSANRSQNEGCAKVFGALGFTRSGNENSLSIRKDAGPSATANFDQELVGNDRGHAEGRVQTVSKSLAGQGKESSAQRLEVATKAHCRETESKRDDYRDRKDDSASKCDEIGPRRPSIPRLNRASPKSDAKVAKSSSKTECSATKADPHYDRRDPAPKLDADSSGPKEPARVVEGQSQARSRESTPQKRDVPSSRKDSSRSSSQSRSVTPQSQTRSRCSSSKTSSRQMTRTDSSEGSAASVPVGRSKSSSSSSSSSSGSVTSQGAKIRTTASLSSGASSVNSRQSGSPDARGKPPVPKSEATCAASGKNLVVLGKYVNKDFRKSTLNMENGDPSRSKYERKAKSQRSVSVSSQDSEPSSEPMNNQPMSSGSSASGKSSRSKLKMPSSSSGAKAPLRRKDASKFEEFEVGTKKRSATSTSSSATDSGSSGSSSSGEEEDDERQQRTRSDSRARRRRDRSRGKISAGSSRTSVLASSADEISLSMDKPPRPPSSSSRSKSDASRKTEDAKSFLMRALAPVTNLFKSKHQDSAGDHARPDCWTESSHEGNSENGTRRKGEQTSSVSKSVKRSSSKSFGSANSERNREASRAIGNCQRRSPEERPWWLDPNSDNVPEGIERIALCNDDVSQDTTVSTALPDDGKFRLRVWREESGERAWWLDGTCDGASEDSKRAENSVATSSQSRKGSSRGSGKQQQQSEREARIRHQRSGERAWWMSDDPENVPEGVEVIVVPPLSDHRDPEKSESERFPRIINKIRHIDSGERPWWMDSNSNVPNGVIKIVIETSNSASDSSDSYEKIDIGVDRQVKGQVDKGLSRFPIEFPPPPTEEPLGDRASPEGVENPPAPPDNYGGRDSPYDNVQPSGRGSSPRKRPSTLPLFIGEHTNIDDLLDGSSLRNRAPLIRPAQRQRQPLDEGSSEDSSECEEIDATQVIIHDSTPKTSVIERRKREKERPQPDGYIPLDDTALQLYKDGDYGAYLDLEASISEQQEEFEGFQTNRKNSIVLRTQLSVRVHTIIEKLLNSEGRELRRALFSLKQIFQEDKDLVHEFVQNDGLACLIKVGSEADQNYQNYILRALGQVMLYVDGMNGVMEHGQTVQWLYTLIASRFRLVVKTALKLLLVFVEYVETNSLLLVRAVRSVDTSRGMIPWTNVMKLLKDYDAADTELLIYATTLVNKCLNGIPDQDTYYDQVDCLEEQGIEGIIQRYMSKQGTDLDLLRQFQIYEAVLHHEDGNDRGSPIRQLDDNIRKTLRNRKSLVDSHERRKSRRHSTGTSPLSMSLNARLSPRLNHSLGLNSLNNTLNSSLPDDDDESSSSQSSQGHLGEVQLNGSYKENKVDVGVTPALRRRRERAERQRSFIREQQEATANMRASVGHTDEQESSFSPNVLRYTNGSSYERNADSPSNKLSRTSSRKDLTPLMNAANKLDSEEKKPWYGKSPDEGVECDEGNHTDEDEDRRVVLQLKREGTVKDLTQKLTAQNLIPSSPVEEKVSRIGDMSGLISKAKEGLAKSKSKADVLKSPTGDNLPKLQEAKKSENELHWEELVNKLKRPLALCDLNFTDLNSDDEVDVLGPVNVTNGVPPPPPPMVPPPPSIGGGGVGVGVGVLRAPPPPPPGAKLLPPPIFGVNLQSARSSAFADGDGVSATSKSPPPSTTAAKKSKKTVKLFWKEVRDDPIILSRLEENKMIWDELSPVPVDTQKLEHLFESRAKDLITKKQQEMNKNKEIIVLDHKRSNAINIGMTKLPPPRSIKTAILKMDATIMNREGIEKLLTMLPTEEERSRIQEAQAANPDLPLGSAEQFLLTLASISELPARLKLWAFKLDFENSEKEIADPLMDLKQGMETLRVNKTFRGILSTLLSIGIFLNGNEVKGFQLEYLAKVPEVKDTVHKHSLLHHLCHMVMEKFPDSTDLYSEIGAVTRASKIDFDELASNIGKLESECKASWDHLKLIAKHDGSTMMKVKMSDFLADCAERIIVLGIVHRRILNRFHKFILWLGIPLHRVQDTKPNEFCRIVSEFALEYRTTRERVIQQLEKKANHRERNKTRGKMITEVGKFRTKEDRADAELRQLLGSDISDVESIHGTLPWRRQRKDGRTSLGPLLRDETTNGNLTDGDDELLESLVKTATKTPATRTTPRERKRTRHADRKSLRRTLKNGLSEEEKKHIAAYIKGY